MIYKTFLDKALKYLPVGAMGVSTAIMLWVVGPPIVNFAFSGAVVAEIFPFVARTLFPRFLALALGSGLATILAVHVSEKGREWICI